MISLHENDLLHIAGGNCVRVFIGTYTSFANILTQKPNTLLEATSVYQHLGHRLGELVYTMLHPDPIKLEF